MGSGGIQWDLVDHRFLSQGLPPLDPASSPGVDAPNTFLLQIQQLKQQVQLI